MSRCRCSTLPARGSRTPCCARAARSALSSGFSASRFWDDVRRFEATITIAIHGMVTFMLDQPLKPDDAENPLKTVYMGPLSRHKEFAERFGVRIYTAYGMTEVPVPIASALDPDDERSCGVNAAPGQYELRLVDENDLEVPPTHRESSSPGTCTRGRSTRDTRACRPRRPKPGATAGSTPVTSSRRDEEGNFFFLDRIKDVIRRRGENISSFEVETEVMSHPLVKEAAAVAVPTPDMEESAGDEEVKVVVVLEPGAVPILSSSRSTWPAACLPTGCRASSSTSRSCRAPSRTSSRRPRCGR